MAFHMWMADLDKIHFITGIAAGSDRLLVVGLGTGKSTDGPLPRNVKASPVNVLAKVLNALMLDHVDYDLIRLGHVNRLLSDGEDVFGGQFIERLNHMVAPIRGASYRIMPHVVLRPSRDLCVMAAQHVKEKRMRSTRSLIARVVRTLARMEG